MNRGGTAVDTKTPLKDGGNAGELGRATKSGRKVKRPAHFDDSPDAKRSASVVARDDDLPKRKEVQEVAKKSARKTLLKNQSEDGSPQRNGAPAPEVGKKSARKTLNKQETRQEEPEPTQRSSRKTMTVVAKEDTPEPEDIKKSARKTLPKSAVKKPSEPAPETPKRVKQEVESPKKSTKKVDVEEETPAGPGISRTGRKIKIPAHLKEFEDVVVPSPKKELAEKPTLGRKSLAPAAAQKEEVAPKTPGRGRSLAAPRKAPEPETKVEPKTPRFVKSSASLEIVEQNDPLALPLSTRDKSPRKDKQVAKSPVKALKSPVVDPLKEDEPVKTSRRGKSLAAPESPKSPPAKAENPPAKTPSKRGKSMAASVPVSPPEKAPKTPKQAASKSVMEDLASAEPMSRSGRKIKPKKYFGEFEEEEPVAVVAAPTVKVPSPVKAVVKSSPVAKKEPIPARTVSPVKAVAKSSPVAVKVASPITRKESPKVASPVKRHLQPVAAEKAMELPKKRAKLAEQKPSGDAQPEKKLDEISPNTEERQITKRGVNDHHHMAKEDEAEESTQPSSSNDKKELPTKDDKETAEEQKPKRGRKPLAAKSEETPVVVEESKPAEEEQQQQPEKPKRGRKTLPAPSAPESSDGAAGSSPPKAPKTPVARRMTTTAALVAPVTTEDVGSSRSGRKIKPKKFFGEDEPASATKAKPAAPVNGAGTATGGGRGRRKTLAAELDKADKVEEVTPAAPQAEVKECPSREEILAVVGVADTVGQTEKLPEPEKMEVAEEPSDKAKAVEEEQEVKKDDEPTPMEEDLPQELEPESVPEPITTPIVGTVPEEALAEDVPQEVDESESEPNSEAPAANGDCPTVVEPLPEHQMESVEPEDDVHDGEGAAVVPEEDEERTLQGTETVESTQEDFQEHSIPQTSPRDQPMIPEEVPESPAPLHEEPPVVVAEESQPVAEPEEVEAVPEVAEVIEETEQEETDQEVPVETVEEPTTVEEQAAPVELLEPNQQHAEVSASSSFSEALCVEEESTEQIAAAAEPVKLNDSKEQQYESVEFLEMSAASTGATEQAVVEPLPVEHTNGLEEQSKNRITTPELEDDLDNTEAPPMDDLDDEREDELLEDVQEPQEATFSERDRDNESIIVIPDTPKPPKSQEFDEEFDLMDKSPVPQSSYATVGRVELHHSPVMKQEVPTTPRTPDSKPAKSSCSPDKPDDQEQADVPEAEVIDITDSPITVLEPKLHNLTDGQPGSTTSTPLRMGSKMTAKDRLIQNSRKRSLSASDAEIVKKNVTFHSPANSTMLVDTIDERLKKKNESATKIPHGHRKRSHSEHKDVAGAAATQDGPKPSKISKLPNFKNIHQQQFNRMESIEEFHNRKVQRAKEILATSTVKSPAATALVRSAERPQLQKSSSLPAKSPHKTGNGASSSSSSYKPAVVRPLIPKPSATESSHHKPLSDADRQEKRQKQFHATFKPKSQDGTTPGKDTPDGAHRVVEQSRHKQNQILKGVRTNKRFELMMKYRDAHE